MRANRSKNTGPEVALRKLLRGAGLGGYRLHWRKAPGRPDIAYPGRKVAIFVHGCFWHRCPTCNPPVPKAHRDFWEAKFVETARRDQAKESQLAEAGWRVLTVWECAIKSRPDEVLAELSKVLRGRSE